MKTSLRIARLELNTLFYSPIAWFLAIVFLFQCGLSYTSGIQNLIVDQQLGGIYLSYLDFSTTSVFGSDFGLFGSVLSKVYLYLPLLTMGLISREVSNGTIKLLYSSPIRVSQLVLGKFMAMMVYNLLLIIILGMYVLTGIFNIRSADIGMLLSGLLGIYLLLCAYAAIGLFMSSLTSYQVVAAISTLVVFAFLAYVGTVWQDIDFVRDLTYFLSIAGRANHMIRGLISTKDVLYFIIIIYLFLSFCMIKLKAGRESRPWFQVAGKYILVFVSALGLGYISSIAGLIGYYDCTADKTQTLTANTRKIVSELGDEPLEITSYINLLDQRYWQGKPDQRNRDRDRWEPFLRYKSNITFKYVYYYDVPSDDQRLFESNPGKSLKQIAQIYANSFKVNLKDFKTPEEIHKVIDLRPELNRYVMQVKYKGRTTFLRLFDDPAVFPSETEISAAFKRLMVKLPKIAFLEGQYERNKDKPGDKDYSLLTSRISFRPALVNQGFDLQNIDLERQDVPQDLAVLVVADPRAIFPATVATKIRQYINDGGNVLFAGEPGKQDVLNPILAPLGIRMIDGIVLQKSKDLQPNMVQPLLSAFAGRLSPNLSKVFRDSLPVSTPGVAGLDYTDKGTFTITPVLATNAKLTWNKKDKLVLDSAAVVYSAAGGDVQRSFPVMVALTRNIHGKEQRIIISGDADLFSNAELGRGGVANFQFDTPIFGWFTYGQFPINTSRPSPKDNHENLTAKGLAGLKVLFQGVLPGLLAIIAAVFLIRRKRK